MTDETPDGYVGDPINFYYRQPVKIIRDSGDFILVRLIVRDISFGLTAKNFSKTPIPCE